ncbi:MAG: MarR family transcriptional regulator [Planctomycetales bacterium]|nr:MarR family transcriptional regulator [Planctomycetales bacterium]
MPDLTRIEFLVLNNLADEPESFSMLFADTARDLGGEVDLGDVAAAASELVARGFARVLEGGEDVTAGELLEHYGNLEEELVAHLDSAPEGTPFEYSAGEVVYEMTDRGRAEWERPGYEAFWPEDGE